MNEKDYSAQKKHIRTHYARFPLDLRPEVLEEFKKACADNGTTPTTEIRSLLRRIAKRRGISNYRQGRQKCRLLSYSEAGGRKNAQTLNMDRPPKIEKG